MPDPKPSLDTGAVRIFCGRCGKRIIGPAVLEETDGKPLRFHKICYERVKDDRDKALSNKLGPKVTILPHHYT